MNSQEIFNRALRLRPDERFALIERLLQSLDESEVVLEAVWLEEAKSRLAAYRAGRLTAIPLEEVFPAE